MSLSGPELCDVARARSVEACILETLSVIVADPAVVQTVYFGQICCLMWRLILLALRLKSLRGDFWWNCRNGSCIEVLHPKP